MHTEQNATHNHSKLCLCPAQPPPSNPPPKPHTTTLEIIQAYFMQITPPGLKSIKNTSVS